MSAKPKQQNKKGEKKKKRKNISPLSSANTCKLDTIQADHIDKHGSDNRPIHGSVQSQLDSDEVSKRLRYQPTSPVFFSFDSQTYENRANMNFSQQPYTGQYMQSPPGSFSQMIPPLPNSQPVSNTQPPQWAVSMMEEIKSIKENVSKIQSIEKTVNSINTQLSDLKSKVDGIDKRVVEVESSLKFVSDEYEENSKELKNAKEKVQKMQEKCSALENEMKDMKLKHTQIKDKVLDGEYRDMRNNLIFYGIPEPPGSRGATGGAAESDSCEKLVKQFTKEHLNLNSDSMLFDRSHRLGNPATSKSPRPIIVRFNYYQDCEKVRAAAQLVRENLKRTNHGVGVQLPKEWRDARKSLYSVMRAEKDKGNTAKFIGDKLYVNGTLYNPPDTTRP